MSEEIVMDNWKHRSKKMRCETCMAFVIKMKIVKDVGGEHSEPTTLGRCRRHAPTLGGWPAVFVTDWCYDHKLDESKI